MGIGWCSNHLAFYWTTFTGARRDNMPFDFNNSVTQLNYGANGKIPIDLLHCKCEWEHKKRKNINSFIVDSFQWQLMRIRLKTSHYYKWRRFKIQISQYRQVLPSLVTTKLMPNITKIDWLNLFSLSINLHISIQHSSCHRFNPCLLLWLWHHLICSPKLLWQNHKN